ncbi:MAG: transglutaminase-like domain-containing protein, partial [Planctomycetota bacterium]
MKTIRNFVLLINALFFISTILENLTYAQEGKLIRDTWTRSTMGEDEIGWTHEVVFEIVKEGRTQYKSKNDVVMEFKRFGQGVTISMESWALENEEGSILEMHQKSMMSGQATLYDLVVEGEKACLTITTMGTPRKSEIDWNAETIGTMGIWKLRQKKGNVPGIEYSYKAFLFEYMQTVKMSIKLEDYEETELLDNAKAKLFRAINTIDLLPGVNTIEWWSDDFITQKTSVKMMGLSMESFHTTKERAMKEGNSELKGDVILETMAKSNINIPVPYKLDSILYRFIPKDPAIGLPKNMNRLNQKVLEQNEKEAIVRISAVVPESAQSFPIRNPPPELMEYLEANAYIQCDHPPLQQKALDIVKDAKDAWQAACLLENFVFTYIKDKNFGTGFASAAEVFENPCGDCSEHGVLLVAMCRAVGIPSRVAMGYMYLGGIFGGHMWAEVWMEGKWYPIDGVMGIGRVDPTHITFTDTSLHNGGLSQAFASAITGLGNIELQIIEFTRGDHT